MRVYPALCLVMIKGPAPNMWGKTKPEWARGTEALKMREATRSPR
ncbi:hypothetical protein Shell_0580 [Staphylothermus hellenicus DSM 12710]|uniref:Uncharacterized protein n=1 Tax=Staphylothermus hellenicus (strain DSM 12710 / JCM 10830 / BK20S6-10-b1 / P8) TaxID=591019 RepID=D7DC09_STAHD|nr:hypothetical protein Shell_0580 [Staphylothermus hellenicus DSM 12710]